MIVLPTFDQRPFLLVFSQAFFVPRVARVHQRLLVVLVRPRPLFHISVQHLDVLVGGGCAYG
jgi:hypothetical protein